MIFLEFFLIIFNAKVLDNVSMVFPDLDIIIKRIFGKYSFFFNETIYFHLNHQKNKPFFFIVDLKKS